MPLIGTAQTNQLSHIEDLNFPNADLPQYDVDLGHFPGDIIYCEDVNKIYIQCSDCILVLSESAFGNEEMEIIPLTTSNGNLYRQSYAPFDIINDRQANISSMAYKQSTHELFVVSPDLRIMKINTQTDEIYEFLQWGTTQYQRELYNSQTGEEVISQGSQFLKFDETSNYLYYSAIGPKGWQTGHSKDEYFCILDTDNPGNNPLYERFIPDGNAGGVYDIAFHPSKDYFFVSRKFRISVFKYNPQSYPNLDVEEILYIETPEKNGTFLYIEEHDHMLCLPNQNRRDLIKIFAIDCSSEPLNVTTWDYPYANKVFGVHYDEVQDEIVYGVVPSKLFNDNYDDIHVCQIDWNASPITHQLDYTFTSNPSQSSNYPEDSTNHTLCFVDHGYDNNGKYTIVVTKKHEIGQIKKVQGTWQWIPEVRVDYYNNYFFKGVKAPSFSNPSQERVYCTANLFGGIRKYNVEDNQFTGITLTAQYLSDGIYNTNENLMYFFGNERISGGYIYTINPENNVVENEYAFSDPIGDCIFNPYNNQYPVLVSHYKGNNEVSLHSADFSSHNTLPINNLSYYRNMFISPDKKIYIAAGMHVSDNQKMLIYDAENYSLLNNINLYTNFTDEGIVVYANELQAKFLYNENDNSVYIIMTHDQNPFANNMADNSDPDRTVSVFGKITDGQFTNISAEFNNNEQTFDFVLTNNNKIFLAQLNGLQIYNCNSGQFESTITNAHYIDLEYDPVNDIIYALNYGEPPDESLDQVLYKINSSSPENPVIVETLNYYISSIKFIDNTRSLLAYSPFDYEDQNLLEAKLYCFEVDNNHAMQEIAWEQYGLGKLLAFNALHFDIVYAHENNKVYTPNGAKSIVSAFEFSNELYRINDGEWAWLSFPRLNGNPAPNQVLGGDRIIPDNYRIESELLAEIGGQEEISSYNGTFWPSTNIPLIESPKGYKLKLLYNSQPEDKWLKLTGTLANPEETFLIVDNDYEENWLGYYLPENQHPFDAFPADVLDELMWIKGQYWSCQREEWPDGTPSDIWFCAAHQGEVEIKYGDMVMVESWADMNFQWQRYGIPPQGAMIPEPDYFTYTEQADYTPLYVEMDTTENPLELGAFIGDTCVGATTVLVDDTTVLVPGYMEGMSGELTFQEYNGNKSSTGIIKKYKVKNKRTGTWEERKISAREGQDYYFVSLKDKKKNDRLINNEIFLSCFPNPAHSECIVEYQMDTPQFIHISVHDIFGNIKDVIYEGSSDAGYHQINWPLTGKNGNKLTKGVYIIKLKSNGFKAQTKVIISN